MKSNYIPFIVIITMLMIGNVSAGIFSIEDAKAAITLKTISSTGTISKDAIPETSLDTKTIQTVQVGLTSEGKYPKTSTMQLYPKSTVSISSDFKNTMQTSTEPGYPLLEVYYGYQKSTLTPWEYYFRVKRVDADYAYIVFGDFKEKSLWLGKIKRSMYDEIISGGKIPDWNTVKTGVET